MIDLVIVSLVWAFSFGLIKTTLAGLDSNFVACARLLIAFAVFAPFLRLKGLGGRLTLKLVLIGMVQFGIMYAAYIASYRWLAAHEVALYTIFTPLYVTLIHDALDRRFHPGFLFAAALAVLGTYVIVARGPGRFDVHAGFLLLQVSNLCFAFGQVAYRRVMARRPQVRDRDIFGLLYLGGVAATAAAAALFTDWSSLAVTGRQAAVLVYLGILASAAGFFLWNLGARQTNPGALAVVNNLKIPLAVACSMVFFGETGDLPHLLAGGVLLIAALLVNERFAKRWAGVSENPVPQPPRLVRKSPPPCDDI